MANNMQEKQVKLSVTIFIDLLDRKFYCRRDREQKYFCLRPGGIKKIAHPAGAPEKKLYLFWLYKKKLFSKSWHHEYIDNPIFVQFQNR